MTVLGAPRPARAESWKMRGRKLSPGATPSADALAGAHARLGADVVCNSFIVMDLHHPLLAG